MATPSPPPRRCLPVRAPRTHAPTKPTIGRMSWRGPAASPSPKARGQPTLWEGTTWPHMAQLAPDRAPSATHMRGHSPGPRARAAGSPGSDTDARGMRIPCVLLLRDAAQQPQANGNTPCPTTGARVTPTPRSTRALSKPRSQPKTARPPRPPRTRTRARAILADPSPEVARRRRRT